MPIRVGDVCDSLLRGVTMIATVLGVVPEGSLGVGGWIQTGHMLDRPVHISSHQKMLRRSNLVL